MKAFTKKDWLLLSFSIGLCVFGLIYNQYLHSVADAAFFPKPLTSDEIKQFGNNDPNTVVIYPILTQFAYQKNGFYDYYKGNCPTCTTVSIKPYVINPNYDSNINGFEYLLKLNYPFITDMTVDKHPEILNDYTKIILLHNEYVTKNEFNAILNHKNVLYLYPDSMFAEVSVNYTAWNMTLVRGHGYPEKNILNGFGYVTSSQHEYDTKCLNYQWKQMPNGIEPTCYPEYLLTYDHSIFQTVKDFPNKLPNLIPLTSKYYDISGIGFCDHYGNCTEKLDHHLNNTP